MKDKKKDKRQTKKSKVEEKPKAAEDDTNSINYSPNIQKCDEFLKSGLEMIVESTNKVCNLEDDLMPFLQKEKQPNF